MPKWRSALSLSRADARLLIEAAGQLLRAWALLRLISFERLAGGLARTVLTRAAVPADCRKVRWAVETAARNLPLPLSCLPQAFAACWMLQRRGGRPQLRYGVAKAADGFESHAWVELDGVPVVGHRVAARFTLLASFPGAEGGC